jgi:GntR family transcriptional regulator, transcriptional repressor for pyruvate dehydrogenase complex
MTGAWRRREHAVSFEKVRPKKVSAVVAQQIVDEIKAGTFPVGSKLPSEFELAEQMGVSRPSIREALSALAAVGLIESRPGSGNYVQNGTMLVDFIGREALVVIENEDSCIDIMEARGLFEPPAAGVAAVRRTQDDLTALRSIYKEIQRLSKQGVFDPYFDADKAFHLLVVESTHNSLIQTVLAPLVQTMDQQLYREFTRDYYLQNQLSLEEVGSLHEEILAAFARKDAAKATQKMHEHWERMQRAVM